MAFGQTPLSTTTIGINQFPTSAVAVPGEAGGNLTALEGGPESTDSNGNKTAPASTYVKDGGNVVEGVTTDSAVTGDNPGTQSAKLRGLNKILFDIWDSVNHLFHFNLKQIGGNSVVTGGANGLLAVGGPVASGSANADNPVKMGGVFNTTQPTVTNGQVVDLQATARGARIVATGVDGFTSVVQAVAGTALAADQSNSELRVSNYGKSSTAGDTPLAVDSAGNLKLASMNGVYTQVYSTTQTGVTSWAGSGDITNMHLYSMVVININVTAITGTNIQFTFKRKDSFGNYISVFNGTAITAVGSQSLDIGPGLANNRVIGDIIQVTATVTSATVTFTVDIEAR